MRRFRFRLAPLLRLRAQFERSQKRELANAMGVVNSLDQRLVAAGQGLADCAAQAGEPGAQGQLARALEVGLRRHQWRLRGELQKAQQKLEVARAEYLQRARDLKQLQNLRDKRRDEWRLQVQKAEQAEIDELAQLSRTAAGAGVRQTTSGEQNA